jgi:hypothetical protein
MAERYFAGAWGRWCSKCENPCEYETQTLLSQSLSTLSTSAPAPSLRVDPTVARRRTCDRGIWTKPLVFAADAGSYAFCLSVSKFVRLQGRLIAAVSKADWSFESDGEGIRWSFCSRVSAGLGWVAVGEDTTAVGAEAGVVESGLGSLLGRVKNWAPYEELPWGPCRQSFHDEHGGGTFGTTEASGLGGKETGECGSLGLGVVVQQQTLTVG